MFPDQIATDRLRLERLCHGTVDSFELYECFAHGDDLDDVFEFVPQEPFRTVYEAHERIDEAEDAWSNHRAAEYVVRPGESEDGAGELAGTTGLFCDWDRRTGRLGLVLRKPFWGRGYSGERAAALLDLAFSRLDLDLVSVGYQEGNERSKRAIERYVDAHGGQYDGVLRNSVPMGDRIDDLYRYTISREQYLGR